MNVYAFITPIVDPAAALRDRLQRGRPQGRLQLPGHHHQPRHRASATSASTWPWPSSCTPGTAGCYQFAPWQVPTTWYTMLGLLVISDFVFYWFHRTGPPRERLLGRAHAPPQQRGDEPLRGPIRASFTQRHLPVPLLRLGPRARSASPPSRSTPSPRSTLLLAYWHHTRLIKSAWAGSSGSSWLRHTTASTMA
jgi:hypothetical protein